MEDPAIYDSSHLVETDSGHRFVTDLRVGDTFTENGQRWRVADTEQHGDDIHLDVYLDN